MGGILNVGSRALLVNQKILETVGNNIANVNTPGYSRQSVVVQSVAGQFTGAGYYGNGVDITTVQRNYSDFLTRQAALMKSVASSDAARYDKLQQLEGVFTGGADGLGASINDMMNSFSDIISAPSDLTARSVALSNADELTARFQSAAGQLDSIRLGVTQQLQNGVAAVNTLATQIAKVNGEIARALGSGHTPNDLLDQRDQLINDLNKYIQTSTVASSDGTVNVFVASSQSLVLGAKAYQIELAGTIFPGDSSQSQLKLNTGVTSLPIDQTMLRGGELAGLLQFKNNDLVTATNLLGRMALAIGTRVNEQQALGLDLKGDPGKPLFSMSSIPAGYPADTNSMPGTALSVAVQYGTKDLRPSDYELAFTSATAGSITRLSDGQVTTFDFSVTPTVVIDGLEISKSAAAAATGDRFLLKPFSTAAGSIQTALSSPRDLAMANPVSAKVGVANTGTLAVAGLASTSVPLPANVGTAPTVTLRFISSSQYVRSDDAGYAALVATLDGPPPLDPNSAAYTAAVAAHPLVPKYDYVPSQAITADGRATNLPFDPDTEWGWSLTLKGSPQPGDTYSVQRNEHPTLNAGNAQSMLNLRDLAMFDGGPLTDGYAGLMAEVGVMVQSAESAATVSQNIAANIEQQRSAVSGVNLDEEAARMLQYQQAYQACGKMMQLAQTMFESLLQSLGR